MPSSYFKILATLFVLQAELPFSAALRHTLNSAAAFRIYTNSQLYSTQPKSTSSSSYLTESEQEYLLNLETVKARDTRSGRTNEEKRRELSSGKILTPSSSVQVLDFAFVKDHTSKAEQALIQAREEYLRQQQQQQQELHSNVVSGNPLPYFLSPSVSRANGAHSVEKGPSVIVAPQSTTSAGKNNLYVPTLMGINQEVIKEVGHPIGAFLQNQAEIQQCAAWLRSLAPSKGLTFEPSPSTSASSEAFSPQQVGKFQSILQQAYHESGEVTEAFAKTFYLGTQLMNENAKKAIWAVYVWCRRTDEIVDAPRESEEEMLRDLSAWEIR